KPIASTQKPPQTAAIKEPKKVEKTDSADASTDTTAAGSEYTTYTVTDSMLAKMSDSTEYSPIDTATVDSTQTADAGALQDSVITRTGTYEDEFVFVSEKDTEEVADTTGEDPLDSVMVDVPEDSSRYAGRIPESSAFDSVPPILPSGEYQIKDYKTKFTPDYMGGGFSYDTFFGLSGQTFFVFSDYLGNQQIYVATDLVNTIDQSIIQAYYFNSTHRVNFGGGFFHTKNYYIDNYNHLFSDRFYGVQGFVSRPFSTFSRLEFIYSQYFIDRKFYDFDDPRTNYGIKASAFATSYVFDNILWGYTGPINGRRAKFTLEAAIDFFDTNRLEYYAASFDYRKYWHFKNLFSMALRFSGAASFGKTPKRYYLGGTTNWIGSRDVSDDVYDAQNLYFSNVVTPMRGVPYYEISGDRYGLMNWEFRFPMIQYFVMRFPLRFVITNVTGAIFTDMGAAWYGSNFKGGTSAGGSSRLQDIKTGFGFGLRANLFNFVLLRYDLAWSTNFATVSAHPTSYFSFGADF
ncbi:MAG: hypothetical protein PVH24_06275, partial [Candidatus Zixiibacteriota bacterium]